MAPLARRVATGRAPPWSDLQLAMPPILPAFVAREARAPRLDRADRRVSLRDRHATRPRTAGNAGRAASAARARWAYLVGSGPARATRSARCGIRGRSG